MLELREMARDVRQNVIVPDFADVVRTGERIRRRRTTAMVATTAAVVVGLGAIGTAGPAVQSTNPAAPPTTADEPYGNELIVVDSNRAFFVNGERIRQFSVTTDGGRVWNSHGVPQISGELRTAYALGPTTIVVNGFITRDSGRSWTKIPGQPTPGRATGGTVSREFTAYVNPASKQTVPAGWATRPLCQGDTNCKAYTIDPVSGAWHPLAHQPPDVPTEIVTDAKGRIWAAKYVALPGDKPSCALDVSTDRGATWHSYPISAKDGCAGAPSVTSDGTAYALVATAGATDHTPGVLVSRDDGKSWQRHPIGMNLAGLYVLPDGTMIGRPMSGDPKTTFQKSTDGGKTFTPIPGTTGAGGIERAVTGAYVAMVMPNEGETSKARIIVSDDGLHWSQIPLPAR